MARPLRPRDLLDLQSTGSVELHPDGVRVAFTIEWPDESTDAYRSVIHLHDGTDARPLTDGHRATSPTFSPDGTRLAFLEAEPEAKPQPMILDLASGETSPVAIFEDGVSALCWCDDAHLAVLAPRRPEDQVGVDDEELARRPRVISSGDYRYNGRGWTHDRRRQIARVSVSDGTVTWLTDPAVDHDGLAPSPDGTALLTTGARDTRFDLTGSATVLRLEVATGVTTALSPPGGLWSNHLGWLDDDQPYAIGIAQVETIELDRLWLLHDEATAPTLFGSPEVSATSCRSADGAVLTTAVRGGRVTVDRHDRATAATASVVDVAGVVTAFDADPDGSRVVVSLTTPTRPAELWEFNNGTGRRLVELNADLLAELDLVEPEIVHVPSSDGVTVEAFAFRPPASAPDRSGAAGSPALLYIHGGPTFAYGLNFFDEFQLAAADGYVVIAGNPRGSDGYGMDWATTIVGRLGTVDWTDIEAIADHLAAQADVDPARVGIGGGSYGGFMTAWAVGHTDRFAAALIERSVINWASFVGTSDIGPFFAQKLLLGGDPPTTPGARERLWAQSPLAHAAKVTTPSLILHSEEDWRCPPEQAEQLFVAYRQAGVEVTFVRFPGENHELSRSGSPRHRLERFGFVHDFFAEHLGSVS